jgi:chromosome segregation ATPase
MNWLEYLGGVFCILLVAAALTAIAAASFWMADTHHELRKLKDQEVQRYHEVQQLRTSQRQTELELAGLQDRMQNAEADRQHLVAADADLRAEIATIHKRFDVHRGDIGGIQERLNSIDLYNDRAMESRIELRGDLEDLSIEVKTQASRLDFHRANLDELNALELDKVIARVDLHARRINTLAMRFSPEEDGA